MTFCILDQTARTDLVTFPPHSRRTDKGQTQGPLLARVVDGRQD